MLFAMSVNCVCRGSDASVLLASPHDVAARPASPSVDRTCARAVEVVDVAPGSLGFVGSLEDVERSFEGGDLGELLVEDASDLANSSS